LASAQKRRAKQTFDPGSGATLGTSIFVAGWHTGGQHQTRRKRLQKAKRLLPSSQATLWCCFQEQKGSKTAGRLLNSLLLLDF
jgi:hypothetical protein